MRIGLIVPGFPADDGDWCIPALHDFVRQLSTHDEVRVVSLRYPAPARRYRACGAEVQAIGGAQRGGLARLLILHRGWRTLVRGHAQAPFDVLHGLWADEPGWLATRVGARLGVPAVVSLTGGELVGFHALRYGIQRSRLGRIAVAKTLESARWCTAGSRGLLQRAAKMVPRIRPERLRLAPLGTDTARFCPQGPRLPASGPRTVLHVGSLTPIKNQRLLLDAFAGVARERGDVPLQIIGAGPLHAELAAHAARLGLQDRIYFRGAVPHGDLPPWYRGAAALAVTSYYESQSLVALEAAACGCPVVGVDVGCLPELGPGCRIVPESDAAALARALLAVLHDDDLRRQMGEAGRCRVEQAFTVQRSVETFRELYGAGDGSSPAA